MGPVAEEVPPVDGETVERLFRSLPRRLPVTVSPVGLAAVTVRTLGRTILLQLLWLDPLRRRPRLLITDANPCTRVCAKTRLPRYASASNETEISHGRVPWQAR